MSGRILNFDEYLKVIKRTARPYTFILSSDSKYFADELIQLQNLYNTLETEKTDILCIHPDDIEDSETVLMETLFPEVYQVRLSSIPALAPFLKLYASSPWGATVCTKFMVFYMAQCYSWSAYLDTDTIILNDFTQELTERIQEHDILARPYYDKFRALHLLYLSMGKLMHDSGETYTPCNAGVMAVNRQFISTLHAHGQQVSDFFNYLYDIAGTLKRNLGKVTIETVLTALMHDYSLKLAHMPEEMHHFMSDFTVYHQHDAPSLPQSCLLHFNSREKTWNSRFLAQLTPQYQKAVLKLTERLSALSSEQPVNQALLFKISSLLRKRYQPYSLAETIRKEGLLLLYKKLTPALLPLLHNSRYFQLKESKSDDRIILWSKLSPQQLRLDLTCSDPREDEHGEIEVDVTLRYAAYCSNSDGYALDQSSHKELFTQLSTYFAGARLSFSTSLLSLTITTSSADIPAVITKLEQLLDQHQDAFLKL